MLGKKSSKGHNSETKKGGTIILLLFYNFQRGITQKLRKGEQSFLCGTLCFDLIYISIKYHKDILKIVYGRTDRQMDRRTCQQPHAIICPFFKTGI